MDFAYTPEQEALRREVRDFIAREVTAEVIAEMEANNEGRPFLMGAFQSGINHGSVQVMRDQVARRGLALPRAKR